MTDQIYPGSARLDRLAIAVSGVCLVHCLVAPVLIALLPSLGAAWHNDLTHWLLLGVAVPVSLWALGRRCVVTGVAPLGIGITGLALMTLAVVRYEGTADERWLTVAGALLVALAHLWRWRATHRRG